MKDSTHPYRISDLSTSDRPRERLAESGPEALNTAELLAILLRVGVAGENAVQMGQRLLNDMKGLSGLQKASFAELSGQRGLGMAKAAQLKAAIELGRRLVRETPEEPVFLNNPQAAADLVKFEMAAFTQEHLWVLLADTRNRWISTEKIYKGSLNASTVRIGELFKPAILRNAASVLLVHNHPSGDPTPSPEDIALTRAVVQVGKLLDIEVLDHIVIGTHQNYVSFKQRGLGFG
ncbi:MAG: JAB domain-containing protein [Chloroflexi bacterium]|nr:MAG: JAB domain-containing protein [Chloroflexota bacterium]